MQIGQSFRHVICLFCNFFLENYQFCRKFGTNANSRGWGNHVISVITTQCIRKSICDSVLTEVHLTLKISQMLNVPTLSSCSPRKKNNIFWWCFSSTFGWQGFNTKSQKLLLSNVISLKSCLYFIYL